MTDFFLATFFAEMFAVN